MRQYSPAEIEQMTGWHPQGLRDMRSKRYLDNFGEMQENGRWVYSARDVVAFWLAGFLHEHDHNPDLKGILGASYSNAPALAAKLTGRPGYRFVAIVKEAEPTPRGMASYGSRILPTNTLDELAKGSVFAVSAIDLVAIAEHAPDAVRSVAAEVATI